MENKPIVFYDGDCGFCNRSVQFILNNETNDAIHFAPLQSEFAQSFFTSKGLPTPDMSTFYFWNKNVMHSKSSGALRVTNYLKFPFTLLKIGFIFPRFLRDWVYDFIAKRRHQLAAGFCALPTEAQRKRFIYS